MTYRTQAAAGLIAVLAASCHHRHDPTTGVTGTTVVEGPGCKTWHFPQKTAANPLFQLAAFVGGGGGCDVDECGLNGMWFGDGVGFREIHLGGAPNHEGLRLTGVSAPPRSPAAGRDLVLAIEKDAMALRDRTSGAVMVPTLRLAGTKIILTWDGHFVGKDQRVPVTFTLEILEVTRPAFWDCRPGDRCETGFKYRFSAITNADGGCNVEVCNPNLARDGTDPDTSIAGTAVAFIGDVYDDTGFKVHSREASPRCTADQVPAGQDDVINFACSGTTLSKLYLMRHTAASRPAGRPVPVSQRQALLRMLTADYCGTGETFTHNGVPLAFAARGWPGFAHYDLAATQPLEAIWSDKGAVCIGQPRLPAHTQAEIAGHCPVPACTATQPDPSLLTPPPVPPAAGCDDASGNYLMSATP